jgi:hypothetical protein
MSVSRTFVGVAIAACLALVMTSCSDPADLLRKSLEPAMKLPLPPMPSEPQEKQQPEFEMSQSPRQMYLAPTGSGYDLITPDGIHVKTNGQYKTEEQRKSAATAIDRYWRDVRRCALEIVPQSDTQIRDKLIPEFPRHLSIEIADDWRIVEGPVTHHRMQAFPSFRRPGAFATASRTEEALYVKVVPELNGLPRQMAGELNLWLGGNTNTLPNELSNVCADLPCYRFGYNNSPSQAWNDCQEQ